MEILVHLYDVGMVEHSHVVNFLQYQIDVCYVSPFSDKLAHTGLAGNTVFDSVNHSITPLAQARSNVINICKDTLVLLYKGARRQRQGVGEPLLVK